MSDILSPHGGLIDCDVIMFNSIIMKPKLNDMLHFLRIANWGKEYKIN